MAEFEDKLNSILSNPEAMAQIMQMAQSLGGSSSAVQPPPAPPPPAAPDLSGLIGGLDTGLLLRFLPIIQELGNGNSQARQLLLALRPYLKTERQDKVERALQLARLFHVGKQFLSKWEG